MNTYDQIDNPDFRETCIQADKAVQKAVKASDWSEANVKKGYLNGLAFRFINAADMEPERIEEHEDYIETRLDTAIMESDYGRAAFWKAYKNGWGVASVMIDANQEDSDGISAAGHGEGE